MEKNLPMGCNPNLKLKRRSAPDAAAWIRRLIYHQLDEGIAAQGFGIRAGFVRFVHDELGLGASVSSLRIAAKFHEA